MCTLPNNQSMSNASYYNRRASLWVHVDVAFVPRFPSNRRFFQRIFACEHLFAGHRCKCARKTIRGTQRGFPPEFTENPFQAIQSIFRPLEMHSKWRYKICMRSINDSFRNYNGLSIIFPKTLDASQRLTKKKNSFDSYIHHIFESENFRFPFSQEKQPNVGCEILQKIAGN